MTKKNIAIIAVSAVVVAGAAIAAVPIAKHFTAKKENGPAEETTSPAFVYEIPTGVDENAGGGGEDVSVADASNVIGSVADIANVTKKAANSKVTTTKSVSASTTRDPSKKVEIGNSMVDELIGENGKQFLGYRKSGEGYYYTDDKDCWQKGAGYNEVYDNMAGGAGMYIDQIRIRFTYGDKDWMVQFWKGQYGYLLVGAEIGLYTAPKGTYKGEIGNVNHYNCADQSDWLYMQLDCYFDQNGDGHYVKIFTRPYAKYWWPTGFVKGQLTKYTRPRTELKVKGRITFKSTEMANLFVNGLGICGFGRAGGATSLADDTYYQDGADVWVLWSTIYHECFVGYEG